MAKNEAASVTDKSVEAIEKLEAKIDAQTAKLEELSSYVRRMVRQARQG